MKAITAKELVSFKELATLWLTTGDRGIERATKDGELEEVKE
jgi:hypothetical protein